MNRLLYGCCYKGVVDTDKYEIDYIDIIDHIDKPNGKYIRSDIRDINFNDYDVIICSPPCNYYCRANYRRDTSEYSQLTKDLLPYCIKSCIDTNKPFIVENVRYPKLMKFNYKTEKYFTYYIGRHTYFTNVMLPGGITFPPDNINHISQNKRQGGKQVEYMFNLFLSLLD